MCPLEYSGCATPGGWVTPKKLVFLGALGLADWTPGREPRSVPASLCLISNYACVGLRYLPGRRCATDLVLKGRSMRSESLHKQHAAEYTCVSYIFVMTPKASMYTYTGWANKTIGYVSLKLALYYRSR